MAEGLGVLPPSPALLEALSSLGRKGLRASEMLLEAVEQSSGSRPRSGDVVAYCSREALVAALSQGIPAEAQEFRTSLETVLDAKDAVQAGADPATLVEAVENFQRESSAYEGIHVARLASVIQVYTGSNPPRFQADLFDSLKKLVEGLNSGLHSGVAIEEAVELFAGTVETLRRVFVPLPDKLPEIRALAEKTLVEAADVEELVQWAFVLRHLNYFFRHTTRPEWLEALWNSQLLQPQESGLWPASTFLLRLIEEGNNRPADWLNNQDVSAEDIRIHSYLWLSWKCGSTAIPLALKVARLSEISPNVLNDLVTFLHARKPDPGAASAYVDLLDALLNHLSDEQVHFHETLLRDFVKWLAKTEAAPQALRIIGYKLSKAYEANPQSLMLVAPVNELLSDHGRLSKLELLLLLAAEVAVAASGTHSIEEILEALLETRGDPRSRVVGHFILHAKGLSLDKKLELIQGEVKSQDAHPETIAALREVSSDSGDNAHLVAMLDDALGEPPLPTEIASQDPDQLDGNLRRVHHWLPAMPSEVRTKWAEPDAVITGKIGKAPPDARAFGPVVVTWGDRSPFESTELEHEPALDVASRIRSWRPEARVFGGASVGGLARTLKEVVERQTGKWSARPVEVISELRHPIYIASYFTGLAESPSDIADVEAVSRAVEITYQEPWDVEDFVIDRLAFEENWARAQQAGLKLLEKLWNADVAVGGETERAMALVYQAARRRDDSSSLIDEKDPLAAAINRPSMQALEVAFAFARFSIRSEEAMPSGFLHLVEESLRLDGATGRQARALIAANAPFLWANANQWASDSADLIFGHQAPDELGPDTFDLYLKWGRPNALMMSDLSEHYVSAIERGAPRIADHVSIASLWDVEPWKEAEFLIEQLMKRPAVVSEAGEFFARAVTENGEHATRATEFWRLVLSRGPSPDAMTGFGWFSLADTIEDSVWLELMLRTVEMSNGKLEWSGKTAERASEHPDHPQALGIVTALLNRNADPWEVSQVANAGLALLSQSRERVSEEARHQLRERLIELEFYEAEEIE